MAPQRRSPSSTADVPPPEESEESEATTSEEEDDEVGARRNRRNLSSDDSSADSDGSDGSASEGEEDEDITPEMVAAAVAEIGGLEDFEFDPNDVADILNNGFSDDDEPNDVEEHAPAIDEDRASGDQLPDAKRLRSQSPDPSST